MRFLITRKPVNRYTMTYGVFIPHTEIPEVTKHMTGTQFLTLRPFPNCAAEFRWWFPYAYPHLTEQLNRYHWAVAQMVFPEMAGVPRGGGYKNRPCDSAIANSRIPKDCRTPMQIEREISDEEIVNAQI